jgi:hypothetical protein
VQFFVQIAVFSPETAPVFSGFIPPLIPGQRSKTFTNKKNSPKTRQETPAQIQAVDLGQSQLLLKMSQYDINLAKNYSKVL